MWGPSREGLDLLGRDEDLQRRAERPRQFLGEPRDLGCVCLSPDLRLG
jgi:hypothetical protein